MQTGRWFGPIAGGWIALALGATLGFGQDPKEAQPAPAAAPPAAPRRVADLSTRFRFVERYGTADERSRLDLLGQYRVAIRDTVKVTTEVAQGTPERTEVTEQTIFAERPAEVSSSGSVVAAVRHYEAYRITPKDPGTKPSRRAPVEGLTLWYQPKEGASPELLSLTEGRGLREEEYRIVARQLFLPDLAAVLPALPSRVGDRWAITAAGARALLGQPPFRGSQPLAGELLEVRQSAQGPDWEAIVGVKGKVVLPGGETALNARLTFAFPPAARPEPAAGKSAGEPAEVEARGAVTQLRMATSSTGLAEPNSRLRKFIVRELVVGRQLDNPGTPLAIPKPAPTPTEANSWLTYDDPEGKYHFRYPQEFHHARRPEPESVELYRPRAPVYDAVELMRNLTTGDPAADRRNRDPEFHYEVLKERWAQSRMQVIRGPRGWLPEADWAPLKRKVYRIETALRPPKSKGDLRIHNDLYLVQFGRDESLSVITDTSQEPPTAFRKEIEAIIRSFDFGPSDAPAPAPAAGGGNR
jgi:hypothetical protein